MQTHLKPIYRDLYMRKNRFFFLLVLDAFKGFRHKILQLYESQNSLLSKESLFFLCAKARRRRVMQLKIFLLKNKIEKLFPRTCNLCRMRLKKESF